MVSFCIKKLPYLLKYNNIDQTIGFIAKNLLVKDGVDTFFATKS